MATKRKPVKPNIVPAWEYAIIEYVPMAAIKKYHTPAEYKRFCRWMARQTVSGDGPHPWDYARWVEAGMPGSQGKDFD